MNLETWIVVIVGVVIGFIIRRAMKRMCDCDEYLRNDGVHDFTCPQGPERRKRGVTPLEKQKVIPLVVAPCHRCGAELWMGGPHFEECRNKPIHHDNRGWWFWDETWADRIGPYDTQKIAVDSMASYCREVLGIEP